MKSNIKKIIIICFCLLYGMAYGQTGTLYRVPMQGMNNIVRYDQTTGEHVAYSKSLAGDNTFALTDMNTLKRVTIGNGLNVTDFEIIDGLVFFCGENGSGSGFLGWFDINDLFYLGGTTHIDQSLSALGLLTLDNIEVYYDTTGAIRIAGYGMHLDLGSFSHLYRAFEAVGSPTTGMQYRTMDLWSLGQYGDISDVVVTDNFVVYLASDRNQACTTHVGIGIFLQPFPKYDMFGTAPFYYHFFQLSYMAPNHPGYVLPINNDPYNNYTNGVVYPKMVHSVGDEIAVCTYRKDLDVSAWYYYYPCGDPLSEMATYITHYGFDLSALVPSTNNFIQMTSNAIAQLYNGDVLTLDGYEYDPQTKRYAILHRHESSAGVVEHAVTTFNFYSGVPSFVESSYQTAFNTIVHWLPQSMCMDGAVYYTVMGYDLASSDYILWRNSVAPTVHICDRVVHYPVTPMSLVPGKYYENGAKPTGWMPLLFITKNQFEEYVLPCEKICY